MQLVQNPRRKFVQVFHRVQYGACRYRARVQSHLGVVNTSIVGHWAGSTEIPDNISQRIVRLGCGTMTAELQLDS